MSQAKKRIVFVMRRSLWEIIEREGKNSICIDDFSVGSLGGVVREESPEIVVFVAAEQSISAERLRLAQMLLDMSDIHTVHLWGGSWNDDVVREPYLLELTAKQLTPLHSFKSLSKEAFCKQIVAYAFERLDQSAAA